MNVDETNYVMVLRMFKGSFPYLCFSDKASFKYSKLHLKHYFHFL